jgi:hypothetical protein
MNTIVPHQQTLYSIYIIKIKNYKTIRIFNANTYFTSQIEHFGITRFSTTVVSVEKDTFPFIVNVVCSALLP